MTRYNRFRRRYFILVILFFVVLLISGKKQLRDDWSEMVAVSEKCEAAFDEVRNEKHRLLLDNPESLIGPELSGITTTLGNLESKKISENPNFGAIAYRMIKELDLTEGDILAIQMSSSFPTVNIETIIAAEALGLKPVIISSIGASTYGATDETLTYQDMEYLLYRNGYIKSRSVLVTPGGDFDQGLNIDPETLETIVRRLERKGYQYVVAQSTEENLKLRMEQFKGATALINIGGNYISDTKSDIGYFSKYGHLSPVKLYNYESEGLIGAFLNTGRDVLHIINLESIALKYDMFIHSVKDPYIGEGDVYWEKKYPRYQLWILIIFIIIGEMWGWKIRNECIQEICRKAVVEGCSFDSSLTNNNISDTYFSERSEFNDL